MTPTTTISRWVLLAQTGDRQALARLFHEVEEDCGTRLLHERLDQRTN